jgi:AAA15 family ATPase/GTPase
MGDGIWRLLGIALSLVTTRGGVLLIDEIDTGLHYSVLVDMWRLVLETARSLDVQVFATTHSRDCYEALAAVAEPGRNEISLQRIERGKASAIAFSEAEIRQAAERGLEVR